MELFGSCQNIINTDEDAGIKKGGVEEGEEDNEREVHKEDEDYAEEGEEGKEIWVQKEDKYYVEGGEKEKYREVHKEDKGDM